jgi:hypothetical protein
MQAMKPLEVEVFEVAELFVDYEESHYKHQLLDVLEQLSEDGLASLYQMASYRLNVAETILEAIRLEDERRGNARGKSTGTAKKI